jgi:hypothetical protein
VKKIFRNLEVGNAFKVLTVGIIAVLGMVQVAQAAEGDVLITPSTQTIAAGQNFDIEVVVDTGSKTLGAFDVQLNFDQTKVTIDTTLGDAPAEDSGKGFTKGSDATNYTMMSNSDDVASGHFRVGGVAATGGASGNSQHIIVIKAKSLASFTAGSTTFSVVVNELSDELGHTFVGGTVADGEIVAENDHRADVDGSGIIDVVDATLTFRAALGMGMAGTSWIVSAITGDVNCDNITDVVDATLIFRKSLGLDVSSMGWCSNL